MTLLIGPTALARSPVRDPTTSEERRPDERFLRAVEEKIHVSESGKHASRQEVVRKAMTDCKRAIKFGLDSHLQLNDAVQHYLFEQRRDVLRLFSSARRPDDEAHSTVSAVAQRLVDEYGYDGHSAHEAPNYVTTLLAQEQLREEGVTVPYGAAGMEDREHDILLAVREEAFYFQPIRTCQIMNEGRASYWHARPLREARFLPPALYLSAIKAHTDVVRPFGASEQQALSLNPYHLGFSM